MRAPSGRIDGAYHPGKCAKCHGLGIQTRYDADSNLLRNTCRRCGYEWTDVPMDAKRDEKPRARPVFGDGK